MRASMRWGILLLVMLSTFWVAPIGWAGGNNGFSHVVDDSSCYWRTYAIQKDGTVYGWSTGRLLPELCVNAPAGIEHIWSNDHYFVCALDRQGGLWAADMNDLSVQHKGFDYKYIKLADNVADFACGLYHSYVLKEDGSLLKVSPMGNLKQAQFTSVMSDVKEVSFSGSNGDVIVLKRDGTVWYCPQNETQFKQMSQLKDIIRVQTTNAIPQALDSRGVLYSWGHNSCGEVGNGTTKPCDAPVQVMTNVREMGGTNVNGSYAITKNGDLYTWGRNESGSLGNGKTKGNTLRPLKIAANVRSANGKDRYLIKNDGSLYLWGINLYGRIGNGTASKQPVTQPVKVMDNVVSATSAGACYRTFAVKTDGSLWAWGSTRDWLSLGDGTMHSRMNPVQILIDRKPLEEIRLNPPGHVLRVGETHQIRPVFVPADAWDKSLSFKSENPSIAAVSSTGLITAKKPGSTWINVTASNGKEYCMSISVRKANPLSKLSFTKSRLTVYEGESGQFKVRYAPARQVNMRLEYHTSNDQIVSVNDSDGRFTGISPGTATVTVTATYSDMPGYQKTATCKVTVKRPYVKSLKLSKTHLTMVTGTRFDLDYTPTPRQAQSRIQITWTSSNPEVVTVDETGELHALSAGSSVITLRCQDGPSARCRVTVKGPQPEAVQLSQQSGSLLPGQALTLSARVLPASASQKVRWSSSNRRVAKVDQLGRITALKPGSCRITAKAGTRRAVFALKVEKNELNFDKPVLGQSGVCASPKRLYFDRQQLRVQLYLHNATGASVRNWQGATLVLAKGEVRRTVGRIAPQRLKKSLKPGGIAVVSCQFPKPACEFADLRGLQVYLEP